MLILVKLTHKNLAFQIIAQARLALKKIDSQ